jgi:hypothetical protein
MLVKAPKRKWIVPPLARLLRYLSVSMTMLRHVAGEPRKSSSLLRRMVANGPAQVVDSVITSVFSSQIGEDMVMPAW